MEIDEPIMKFKSKIIFCADDFTGASDALATLARSGLRARLYLKSPSLKNNPEIAELDAVGLATALRSMDKNSGQLAMQKIGSELSLLDGDFYHFKICSTFDSANKVGNIGVVSAEFAKQIDAKWTAFIGGQPSLGRFCVFGNLFATADTTDIYRIDRHPLMMRHPITPMNESDMRLHLQQQYGGQIGLINFTEYSQDTASLETKLLKRIANGESRTLFDVSCADDLLIIGKLIRRISRKLKVLCVGASSVSESLILSERIKSAQKINNLQMSNRQGLPVLAVAGSRSKTTSQQVERAKYYTKIVLKPEIFSDDGNAVKTLIEDCCKILRQQKHVLIYTLADTNYGVSSHEMARITAKIVDKILNQSQIGFLTIAGGDTASLVIQCLNFDCLSYISDFDRGAPVMQGHLQGHSLDGVPMVLKGGQMGSIGFFDSIVDFINK